MIGLRYLHSEAQSMRMRSYKDNNLIPIWDFDEYVFKPLCALLEEEHQRQLVEIQRLGT